MKLTTTYAALDLLGPGHVWRTRIYTDGPVTDGVLRGNLVLRGSGDPKLVLERLQTLLAQVQAAGVREVRGDIVLDRNVFETPVHGVPFDDEPLRPYNVQPDGLLLNFKVVIYSFAPDAAAGVAQVRHEPPLEGLQVPPQVPLLTGPCADWRTQLQADFAQPLAVRFAGGYPALCGLREWPVAFAAPDEHAPRMVHAMWLAAGGRLNGQVRHGVLPRSAQLLLEAPSLPLHAVIADINKFSNNVMAQQVFLTLSAQADAPASMAASRLRLAQWWRRTFAGTAVAADVPEWDNGSGLSRSERTSAQALTALLQTAHASPHAQAFVQSLSLAGVDGTMASLQSRLPASPLLGQAWLKTGSLRDVAAVAGYVQGQSGQRHTVVAVINHANANQARPALDALLEWTVRDADWAAAQTLGRGPAHKPAPATAPTMRP